MTVKAEKILKIEEVGYKHTAILDFKSFLFAIGGRNIEGVANPSIMTFERTEKCFNQCGRTQEQGECKDRKCICAPG